MIQMETHTCDLRGMPCWVFHSWILVESIDNGLHNKYLPKMLVVKLHTYKCKYRCSDCGAHKTKIMEDMNMSSGELEHVKSMAATMQVN